MSVSSVAGQQDSGWRAALRDEPALAAVVRFFEHLSPQSLRELNLIYVVDASFKDPFNEVVGLVAIEAIFADMFESTRSPRFVVTGAVWREGQAFLTWDFLFGLGRRDLKVRGCSHLVFDDNGRVRLHRDYWDAAGELYEQLPLIGILMRALRRRLAAH
jgi:steroid Delta-isomerase